MLTRSRKGAAILAALALVSALCLVEVRRLSNGASRWDAPEGPTPIAPPSTSRADSAPVQGWTSISNEEWAVARESLQAFPGQRAVIRVPAAITADRRQVADELGQILAEAGWTVGRDAAIGFDPAAPATGIHLRVRTPTTAAQTLRFVVRLLYEQRNLPAASEDEHVAEGVIEVDIWPER